MSRLLFTMVVLLVVCNVRSLTFVCYHNSTIIIGNPDTYTNVFVEEEATHTICNAAMITSDTQVEVTGCDMDVSILVHFTNRSVDPQTDNIIVGYANSYNDMINCNEMPSPGVTFAPDNALAVTLSTATEKSVTPSFTVSLGLTVGLSTPVTTANVGQWVWLDIFISDGYYLVPQSCTAYSGTDRSASESKTIITDGCTDDDSLVLDFSENRILYLGNRKSYYTKFFVFKFYDSNDIYIVCNVLVCPTAAPCSFTCPAVGRRRRNSDFDTNDSSKHFLTTYHIRVRSSPLKALMGKAVNQGPAFLNIAGLVSIAYILLVLIYH